MVVGAHSLTSAEIHKARLVQARDGIDSALAQQGNLEIRANIAIRQEDAAAAETVPQLPQQSQFALTFAAITADSQVQNHSACQREDRRDPRQREPHTRLLRTRLGIPSFTFTICTPMENSRRSWGLMLRVNIR
jgi:hypothetical protein